MFMPVQAVPYLRLAKRVFSGRGSIQSRARRQEILCPEEKETIRPAVALPGQIERVTGADAGTTKEREIEAATSTTFIHAPTIAYHVNEAALLDGSIYVGSYKHLVADKSLFGSAMHDTLHLGSSALTSSYLGAKYFGHWLFDDCIKYLLAKEFSEPLCLRRPASAFTHQNKYEVYFDQDWTPIDRAWIDHLVVFQDFSQNSLKRKRYKILRDRIQERFPSHGRRECIYLRRGRTGVPRAIENEDEILNAVVKQGFIVLDVLSDSLDHIIGTLVNAKVVISMEGSQIAHCVFAVPENSGLLMLQPPDRFLTVHRGWTGCLNVRFGFVVGAIAGIGYSFSVSEILRTTDLMLRNMDALEAL